MLIIVVLLFIQDIIELDAEDAANTDTDTSDNIKLQILQTYSENIADIIYTEGNNSGYFKMDGEYFRFTVDDNSIIIRNDTDKIVNIINIDQAINKNKYKRK